MSEYSDPMCQRAYENGIADALAEVEPSEPEQRDREWLDNESFSFRFPSMNRDEYIEMMRDDIADAMDEQWSRGLY